MAVAESTVALLAAFAKTGDPSPRSDDRHHETGWPRYELNTQQYLSIGECYPDISARKSELAQIIPVWVLDYWATLFLKTNISSSFTLF